MPEVYTVAFEDLGSSDVGRVGGKNASLGEMIGHLEPLGVRVPVGFATTASAYWEFLRENRLEERIRGELEAYRDGRASLVEAARCIREAILQGRYPHRLARDIADAYHELERRVLRQPLDVAVRSSATAEDLPEASFAGQQESFLNVRGEEALLDACRRCYASLFTDRAIVYRENHDFDHMKVALSVGVQQMVRSDLAGAGVAFSIDTETGFPHAVLINAAWGLGEAVVQGFVDPDEYMVFKPLLEREGLHPVIERRAGGKEKKVIYSTSRPTRTARTTDEERAAFVLSEEEIVQLARWTVAIERHYGRPMDIEWAKDGESGDLWIVQARPETVQSRRAGALRSYSVGRKGRVLASGLSIGDAVAVGRVHKLKSPQEIDRFTPGGILVTAITDPDWVPLMKRAAAIVTDHGGRTSHAAIVSRELGLPAVVGTGNATSVLPQGAEVTVSCAEGDEGFVYEGVAEVEVRDVTAEEVPKTRTQVMVNLANPAAAFRWWRLPADGVGLARMEFIIDHLVKIHPMALVRVKEMRDRATRRRIQELTRAFDDKSRYFVETLASGIARIAAAYYPRPVLIRFSDFKTNEYANLIGGRAFEPQEANPMLGWRGASRYYSTEYREGFALECQAVKRVREHMGLDNLMVMIPFCRTLQEADKVLAAMAENGLHRGEKGLEVYVMAEVPSNVILADAFAERFDGFSIGSNDLTQLVLGVDRDSERLAEVFDENDEAVRALITVLIERAHAAGRKVGLCGQAPSDRPEFARFLVAAGIDSISVSPDSFIAVKEQVRRAEEEGSAGKPAVAKRR